MSCCFDEGNERRSKKKNIWRRIDREGASKDNTYALMGKLREADLSRYRNNTSWSI